MSVIKLGSPAVPVKITEYGNVSRQVGAYLTGGKKIRETSRLQCNRNLRDNRCCSVSEICRRNVARIPVNPI